MAHSVKASALIEGLIALVKEDDNQHLIMSNNEYWFICDMCTFHPQSNQCSQCPLQGGDHIIQTLEEILPLIKAKELIDAS